ncbi:MAG: hypothetical protein DRN12_05760 [Thermoplasmata archaeon]|nr:MAG: hypothetical protein DRN12_05760 [Thermoplasmata archaeon]
MEKEKIEIVSKLVRNFSERSFNRYFTAKRIFKEQFKQVVNEVKDVIFVNELIQCKKKREFEMERIRTSEDYINLIFNPKLIIGDAIEDKIKELLNISRPYLTFKKIEVNDETYIIAGSCDGFINDYVVDIKFKSRINVPAVKDILQIKLYAWLYNTKYGLIIIISPSTINIFNYEAFTDSDVKKLITSWKSPMFSEECKYCPFKEDCDIFIKLI